MAENYRSDIVLGRKYREPRMGVEGTATAIAFYEHACERVTIELLVKGEVKEYTFDSPRLEDAETHLRPITSRPGGPRSMPTRGTVE